MRSLCLLTTFAVLANCFVANAAERRFPYEAVVDAENGDNILSGPGAKYYPTSHLNRGDHVIVHRHDPGGLCMIAPPDGSFSWIRASHVQRDSTDRGVLISTRVWVHTGSDINPNAIETYQADLSKGDVVQILDEKNFNFDNGPRLMLKISPVKGEWRWISRKSIVPVDDFKSDLAPGDQSVPKRRGKVASNTADAFAQPVSTGITVSDDRFDNASDDSGTRRAAPEQDAKPGKQRLAAIDRQFREMVQQEPPSWDLDSLETQYQQLDDDVGIASMTATIKLRLDAVKRYRKIYRDYDDFNKLTTETKERDAQLQLQQSQFQSQIQSPDQRPNSVNPNLQPSPQAPTPLDASPQSSASQQSPAGPSPSFDGAGIVQRMEQALPGGPQFALIAPDGRMLSLLQAGPGVDLNRYNNRAMGIYGKRTHRDDWNADLIVVRSLQPVQLRGSR